LIKDGFVHIVYQDGASGNVIYKRGTVADVTGLSETAFVQPEVYPNPSSDGSFIVSGLPAAYRIMRVTDLSGKTVEGTFGKTAAGIHVSLPAVAGSGTYLLILEDASGNSFAVRMALQR